MAKRWFHPNISGVEAEKLLKDKGTDGSFLVRHSRSNQGDFTLSIRRKIGEISHIKIQNTGECYCLYGGDKFATLAELVLFYQENAGLLRERTGDFIELKQPLRCSDPTAERWFHGPVNGKQAEKMLMDKGRHGSFLVRESQSQPGHYVITVRVEDTILHIKIQTLLHEQAPKYDIGGGTQFETLLDLIDFYKKNPMVDVSGIVVHLKQPFNATRITASAIDARMKELEKCSLTSRDGREGFSEEFEQLQQQEMKHLFSRKEGAKEVNKAKNRYKNILPFDHTRVELRDGEPNKEGEDYINANYVAVTDDSMTLSSGPSRRYIATQGPLMETVSDFWRMMWQENCQVIVMTTRILERGKVKCFKYWPDKNEAELEFEAFGGSFIVKHIDEAEFEDFVLREMELSRQGSDDPPRRIYQYNLLSWPDHGIPPEPGIVLDFIDVINAKMEELQVTGPLVVHCSAGIGRTGSFIVIDMLLAYIQDRGIECEIDIQKSIQMLRSQRSGMVQTEEQYKFIYVAVSHFIDFLRGQKPTPSQSGAAAEAAPRRQYSSQFSTNDDFSSSSMMNGNSHSHANNGYSYDGASSSAGLSSSSYGADKWNGPSSSAGLSSSSYGADKRSNGGGASSIPPYGAEKWSNMGESMAMDIRGRQDSSFSKFDQPANGNLYTNSPSNFGHGHYLSQATERL